MARKKQKDTVGFIALGCPKNMVDSERMLAEIAQAGFVITAEPDNADVIVINTCGFIAPAKAESLEAIKHAVDRKCSGHVKKVIVAGCLPQREGQQLFGQVDGIDSVVGLGQRDNIARIIKKTLSCGQPAAYLEQQRGIIHDDRARLLITPGHWAYLRISEGCNHPCSFCTIPARTEYNRPGHYFLWAGFENQKRSGRPCQRARKDCRSVVDSIDVSIPRGN